MNIVNVICAERYFCFIVAFVRVRIYYEVDMDGGCECCIREQL